MFAFSHTGRVQPSGGGGGGGSSTTWDPSQRSSLADLSNGNLTVTADASATGAYVSGLATSSISSGKYFWSTTVVANNPGEDNAVGIANTGFATSGGGTYNDWLGDTEVSLGYYTSTGNVYLNYNGTGDNIANLGGASPGDIVDFAIDGGANLWIRKNGGDWNNNSSADPTTGTGGLGISSLGEVWPAYTVLTNPTQASYTANFGATSFTYAPPSGFSTLP